MEGLGLLVLPVTQDAHAPRGPRLARVELHLLLRFALEVFVSFCSPVPRADTCRGTGTLSSVSFSGWTVKGFLPPFVRHWTLTYKADPAWVP